MTQKILPWAILAVFVTGLTGCAQPIMEYRADHIREDEELNNFYDDIDVKASRKTGCGCRR